jgi:hypothetical protein
MKKEMIQELSVFISKYGLSRRKFLELVAEVID